MNEGMIIDLFAGAGGASDGCRSALNREVDLAVNHDLSALLLHAVNHPGTVHLQEDVFKVKLADYVNKRHVALLWASPACQHFSKARGGKPKSDQQRTLTWSVYQHAKDIRPDVITLENVPEIQTWEDYDAFVGAMAEIGYTFECRELVAADYGVPTTRRRWYAVLRCDGCKTAWPEQTHAKPGTLESLTLPKWRPVAPYIDFEDVGESIYQRQRPLAKATMSRIRAGIERYVTHGEPYVVDGNATFITQFNHNCIGQSMREPMKTITCSPGHFGLVTAFLVSYYGNSHGAQSVGEPLPTITTRDRFGLVTCEVDGSTYRVADVHLRMLKPEELKLAQGFDPSYVIDHYPDGSRVTKSEQTAKIGNSVCPPMAEKIVAANIAAA